MISSRQFSTLNHASVKSLPSETEEAIHSELTPPPEMNPMPDFDTNALALQSKSTGELMRAALTFTLCMIPPLVRNAESLLRVSRALLGEALTNLVLKWTLYDHFCPGPDVTSIQPVLQRLQEAGISPILDYAAEDLRSSSKFQYDFNMETFRQSIVNAGHGCAAIKVSALGDPAVLQRFSRALSAMQSLCIKIRSTRDEEEDSADEIRGVFGEHRLLKEQASIELWIQRLQEELLRVPMGSIEAHVRSTYVQPSDFPCLAENSFLSLPKEEWASALLTAEDVAHLEGIYERSRFLAQTASDNGTRVLIDAEQVRYQPAIDALVRHLQRTYNAINAPNSFPVIFNTYQCYLKDATQRLELDLMESQKYRYHFGVKLVRGAYMESERSLAAKLGVQSPIHDSVQETHNCYANAIEMVLQAASQKSPIDPSIELLCATHNQGSIQLAIHSMNQLGIHRSERTVRFAQLYGMKDNLTYNLGLHGYRTYKYIPYGEIAVATPYLIRRANENTAIRGGAFDELRMIRNELVRRARAAFPV
jgi:proline dehydrogenase